MKITTYLALSYLLMSSSALDAQDLTLYDLMLCRNNENENIGFISFSDRYQPESLAIPYVEDKDSARYFKLERADRERFLSKTKISKTDKVFIYNYYHNILASFTLESLEVVACLNVDASDNDWPYSQYHYRIGFEIDKKLIRDFGAFYSHTFVCPGKENVFVRGQLKRIVWKKIESRDFPSRALRADTSRLRRYVAFGPYKTDDAYKYEAAGLQYFVQDYVRLKDNWLFTKRLLVIERETKKTVYEKIYFSGESASFAPETNQWTGKLLKNKPSVIFGFQYHAFGCPAYHFWIHLKPTLKSIVTTGIKSLVAHPCNHQAFH